MLKFKMESNIPRGYSMHRPYFFKFSLVFCVFALFSLIIFSCDDVPVGFGKNVDTQPPVIGINKPSNNEYMRGIEKGEPIQLSGTWSDDTGVLKLKFKEVYSGNEFARNSESNVNFTLLNYSINNDGTWSAAILLLESGSYRIRVEAYDVLSNVGKDEVNIRIDVVPPWVEDAWIARPSAGLSPFRGELHSLEYYHGIGYNVGTAPYKGIEWENIDDYQNEKFTVRLEIDASLSGIAASRLNIYEENPELDEDGIPIPLNEKPLKPDDGTEGYRPEWTIDADMLINDFGKSVYSNGPHFIWFEVMAWNGSAWDPDANGGEGGGRPDESYLIKTLDGTCWYQESDIPHINIPSDSLGTGQITVSSNSTLLMDIYDDDKLKAIHAGLIKKIDFDEIMSDAGFSNEGEYISFLSGDSAERDLLIARDELGNGRNLFAPLLSPDGRVNTVSLPTGDRGEYRLVVFVQDDKSGLGLPNPEIWEVHYLRVNIVNSDAPIIIVENPASENIFPTLGAAGLGADEFKISGYTVDRQGTNAIYIAWVSLEVNESQRVFLADEAIKQAHGDSSWQFGQARVIPEHQIKVWKLARGDRSNVTLSNAVYVKDTFSQTFHIISDFQYNGALENEMKTFVIGASNGSEIEIKTFILKDYKTSPAINVLYPSYDRQIHSKNDQLVLRMSVSSENSSIGIVPESMTIKDVTTGSTFTDSEIFETDPAAAGGLKERRVRGSFVLDRPEGENRTFEFYAQDILGNHETVRRSITISNVPALLYITSSNAPGTYGIGEVVNFEAVFSMPVQVTGGSLRLKLHSSDPGAGNPAAEKYAVHVPTPAGNTLLFRYTVLTNDNIPKLYTSRYPIDLNGSTLKSTDEAVTEIPIIVFETANNDTSLQKKDIGLDGVRPYVNEVRFKQPAASILPYYNNGKIITLELHTEEPVRVSGNPTAYISCGTGGVQQASFSSINAAGNILSFTYMVNIPNLPETRVSWADQWITFDLSSSITDYAGNPINLSSRPAVLNGGSYPAYIITAKPATPAFTLTGGGTLPPSGNVDTNGSIAIHITGTANHYYSYSLENGNNPVDLASGVSTDTIHERNPSPANLSSSYEPSEYVITAWQTDRAGNRSDNVEPPRNVTINSRAPELSAFAVSQPDGYYGVGETLTFNLVFSRPVTASVPVNGLAFTIKGTSGTLIDQEIVRNTAAITVTAANASPILSFDWTIPAGLGMGDIKAQLLTISGVHDLYGNTVPNFNVTEPTETLTVRPLSATAAPNLVRPSLIIDSRGPTIIGWSPGVGTPSGGIYPNGIGTGADLNGALISANAAGTTITFKYDKTISAQAGKNIIIRPYGSYAVPPVMSADDFNALYNSIFYEVDTVENGEYKNLNRVAAATTTTYQRILKYVDANGLPAASWTDFLNNLYNFYKYTTHGLNESASGTGTASVRPDLTGKYVLDFRHDLYEGVDRLRTVFNAAHWNWQIIPVTNTTYVTVSGDTVTVKLTKALDDGRIWEVIIDRGAFRDNAGNDSVALNPGSYRFWSRNTAKPVIRVDRYSSGEHYQGNFNTNLNLLDSWGTANRPKIDTRVRIDCETPGAQITYDTVRTYVVLGAANYPSGTSGVFTTDWAGYNNSNGNNGNNRDKSADGYFNTNLLMPDTIQTTPNTGITINNGAINWGALTSRGSAQAYRTIPADTITAITNGANTFETANVTINGITRTTYGRFIYVGEAYGANTAASDTVTTDTDPRLYTGRRDYVAAIAKKNAVTDNRAGVADNLKFTGPDLTSSTNAYEGVYKTTLLYRNTYENSVTGTRRLLVMGYDAYTPVVSTVPGFPLQDTGLASPDGKIETSYFWRQGWRYGNYTDPDPNSSGTRMTNNTTNPTGVGYMNHYIWVSWDIACDWYQRARVLVFDTSTVPGLNQGYWNNAVASTYGGVVYRYRQ
jgi:hypothetical protein